MNIGGQTARLNADDLAPHVSDHAYEPQDRRIETVSNGTPTRSVFSGRDILGEYGADWNAAQAHYAYAGLDQPLLKTTTSGTAYYHADGLASIVPSRRFGTPGLTVRRSSSLRVGRPTAEHIAVQPLPLQILRLEMPSSMNDAVDVDRVIDQFIQDAVGIQTDFPHILFADFRHHPAQFGQLPQNFDFFGDVLHHAGGVVFGIVGNILVN